MFNAAISVNFTRSKIKASNEAIIESGRNYFSRIVFPSDGGCSFIQLIQHRNFKKRAKISFSAQPVYDGAGYEEDLS